MFNQESFLPFWLDLSDIPATLWGCYAGLSIIELEV